MNAIAALALGLLVTVPVRGDDDPKKAQEALQGEWKFISFTKLNRENAKLVKSGKVIVSGDKLTIRFDDEDETMTFALDPKENPPAIDLESAKGGMKATIRGVYKMEKDKLTICFGIEESARPTDFKPTKDNGVMVLERVKK